MNIARFFLLLIFTFGLSFAQDKPIFTVGKCYNKAKSAEEKNRWPEVIKYSSYLAKYRPKSQEGIESLYLLGKAYYENGSLEKANYYFTKYLKKDYLPKYFETAILHKYKIAEKFQNGARKPLIGSEKCMLVLSAKEDSLKIYDEVIAALPQSDIALNALFNKAKLHLYFSEFKEAVEAADNFISKFPNNALAIDSYLLISKAYLMQADPKHQEDDLLTLAKKNLTRFQEAFPKEGKLTEIHRDISQMEELYAKGLLEVAEFYYRRKELAASKIYFSKIKNDYHQTNAARRATLYENELK